MKNVMRRLVIVVFSCMLILSGKPEMCMADAAASGSEEYKTVRVGWYQSAMFQEGSSDQEAKSGYCYDYLQKVADYTSWKYEYVYGNWEDLFHKLQNGEIDVLGGVSETDERRKTMLFPEYAMGTDQYYIFKRSNNSELSAEKLTSLNGKTLGGIGDNRMSVLAEEWIKNNNLDLKIVYFKDFAEQGEALQNGRVDLIVQTINNVLNMNDIDIAAKVGEEPFYLAVSKKQEELLKELNYSLGRMLSISPFALQNLQYKNYGANLINKTLSEEEKDWVRTHRTVQVGYLENYLPYSATEKSGQVTGLMTDVFTAIVRVLQLEDSLVPEYHAFQSYQDMIEALKHGEIDTAFPVYGNLWNLEHNGINASAEVVQSSEVFFYRGNYKKNSVSRVAVNRNNDMQQAYCKRVFPDAEIILTSSIEECLNMVLNGTVDGTIVNVLRSELVTRNSKYDSLSYIQMEEEDSRCFGVREGNAELLTILNRGLRVIGSSYGIDNAYKYMDGFYHYSFVDFVRSNLDWIVAVLGIAVVIIIPLLVRSLKRKAMEVAQKEESIRQANALNKKIESLKDKADKANEAKTLFLNNMSHDIRTPMNAIIGYTDIAQKQTESPEVRGYLDKIRDSSEHLLSLINDVLDISRIESGTVTVNSAIADISRVTDEALDIVKGFLTGRNLEFEVVKKENAASYVETDALKIREILVNLLGNAVKFTDDGGKIRFVFEVDREKEGQVRVRYIVSDTGRGMSEEFQTHIFEEFSQENHGARTQYKGTGLGMTITKRYIDMMGGSISFESRKNQGTTFTVELPMVSAEQKPQDSSEKVACLREVSGLKVLLAEDNDLNAEIAQIQLNEVGIDVTRASDGREAIEIFRNSPAGSFDLILMDVMMPNMNGYEATRAIRALQDREDGKQIPIIAMTANAFAEDIQRSLEAGMTAHLTKPIRAEDLIRTVSQIHKLSLTNSTKVL